MKRYWPSGRQIGWSANNNYTISDRTKLIDILEDNSSLLKIGNIILPENRLLIGERGAVMLSEGRIEGEGNSVSITGGSFDVDAVRSTLLLFDKIDCPFNTCVQVGASMPEGLEEWPGIQKTCVEMNGAIGENILENMLLSCFNALDDRESGQWSLARGTHGQSFPRSLLAPDAAFRIKLINALPIPHHSVPYEDVLIFKERRQSELISLRHHIDDIAIEVSKSGFGTISETVAFEKFHKSIADFTSASREENFLKRLINLEIKFQWNELVKNPAILMSAGSAITSVSAGLPLISAAWNALTAFAPAFAIETTLGLRRKTKSGSPFEYIIRAGVEL